jgi:hypothetical protein
MSQQVMSVREARGRGLKFYYTGKPCKKGHIAQRRVNGRICSICAADSYGKYLSKTVRLHEQRI